MSELTKMDKQVLQFEYYKSALIRVYGFKRLQRLHETGILLQNLYHKACNLAIKPYGAFQITKHSQNQIIPTVWNRRLRVLVAIHNPHKDLQIKRAVSKREYEFDGETINEVMEIYHKLLKEQFNCNVVLRDNKIVIQKYIKLPIEIGV